MAFRDEASVVRLSDVKIGSNDAAALTDQSKAISNDAARVKMAIGFIVVIAMIDSLLYLPRLF